MQNILAPVKYSLRPQKAAACRKIPQTPAGADYFSQLPRNSRYVTHAPVTHAPVTTHVRSRQDSPAPPQALTREGCTPGGQNGSVLQAKPGLLQKYSCGKKQHPKTAATPKPQHSKTITAVLAAGTCTDSGRAHPEQYQCSPA